MLIEIDNPERSLRVLDVLRRQEYPIEFQHGIHSWLEEIIGQIHTNENADRLKDSWRRIPEFPKYEISGMGILRRRDTDEEVETFRGSNDRYYVRMTKNRGIHTIDVLHLRNQIFPEIKR